MPQTKLGQLIVTVWLAVLSTGALVGVLAAAWNGRLQMKRALTFLLDTDFATICLLWVIVMFVLTGLVAVVRVAFLGGSK